MPYSAISLSGLFIQKSFEENNKISNLKLQKMIYIANGIYLALTKGEPLVNERVEAWPYGPVIRSVYDEYKRFGSGVINIDFSSSYYNSIQLNQSAKKAFDFTWNQCKDINAINLSNWTHANDSPWTKAVNEGKSIIPDTYMMEYFNRFIK